MKFLMVGSFLLFKTFFTATLKTRWEWNKVWLTRREKKIQPNVIFFKGEIFLDPYQNFTKKNHFLAKFFKFHSRHHHHQNEWEERKIDFVCMSNSILNMSVVINIHFHKTVDVEYIEKLLKNLNITQKTISLCGGMKIYATYVSVSTLIFFVRYNIWTN